MRDWRIRAACLGHDPEIFFPSNKGRGNTDLAATICADCRVRAECLSHALDVPERDGFWGGMTEDERRALVKGKPTRPPCGTEAGYRSHRARGEQPCVACRQAASLARRQRWLDNPVDYRAARKERTG